MSLSANTLSLDLLGFSQRFAPELTPVQEFLCREARNLDSKFTGALTRAIFSQIPTEWFETPVDLWKEDYPLEWTDIIKETILEIDHRICENTLDDVFLKALIPICIGHIRQILGKCSKKVFHSLITRMPIDVHSIIRDNIELDPLLDSKNLAKGIIAKWIIPFLSLTEIIPLQSPDSLVFSIEFLKAMSFYSVEKLPFPFHHGDILLLFVAHFAQLELTHDDARDFSQNVLRECSDLKVLRKLKKVELGVIPTDPEESSLSYFILLLHRISVCMGEESFPELLKQLSNYIQMFQNDRRSHVFRDNSFCLFTGCGPLINGILLPFENHSTYEKACEILESLPPLTGHAETIRTLEEQLFQDKSEIDRHLAAKLIYKEWWFSEYRRGHPVALVEREIDWKMKELLVDQANWGIEIQGAVQIVKDHFRQNLPMLPFNPQRAEHNYFLLQFNRRRLDEAY